MAQSRPFGHASTPTDSGLESEPFRNFVPIFLTHFLVLSCVVISRSPYTKLQGSTPGTVVAVASGSAVV